MNFVDKDGTTKMYIYLDITKGMECAVSRVFTHLTCTPKLITLKENKIDVFPEMLPISTDWLFQTACQALSLNIG